MNHYSMSWALRLPGHPPRQKNETGMGLEMDYPKVVDTIQVAKLASVLKNPKSTNQ